MSTPLEGSEGVTLFNYHLHGGPRDGDIINGYRPYYALNLPEGLYHVTRYAPNEVDQYIIWVDDFTRKIDLYYKPENQALSEAPGAAQ